MIKLLLSSKDDETNDRYNSDFGGVRRLALLYCQVGCYRINTLQRLHPNAIANSNLEAYLSSHS